MSMVTTDIDNRSSRIHVATFADDTFTAGAEVYPDGTLLARNTASGKLVPYDNAGAGGNEIPITVLTYEIDSTAGAGDVPVRIPVDGTFNRNLLREQGVGLISGEAYAQTIYDSLQDYNIASVFVTEENVFDNQ